MRCIDGLEQILESAKWAKGKSFVNQSTFSQGHALIIGVGADLPCTVDDAEGLAKYLTDEARCAYPTGQVTVLTQALANRTGMLAALDTLAQSTEQNDTVIFYFSGHGGQYGDTYYLMAHGYDVHNPAQTAVSGSEFAAKIAAIPAARKVILLDCCHAGGVADAKGSGLRKVPLSPAALDLFQQGSGYVVIASSTEKEYSFTGKPFSVFTGILIEALCGAGVAKKDGYVRVADLALYARERVPQLTGNQQHPVLHFEQADNFAIAYYAGGDGKPKGLPFKLKPDNGGSALTENVKTIEDLFTRARYDRAYEAFRDLCVDYPDYQTQANMLLTRYNEFQSQVISGVLPFAQQNTEKLQIAAAFQACLTQFKREFL